METAARFQVEEDDLGELADWLIAINSGKVPLGNNQPEGQIVGGHRSQEEIWREC